MSLQVQELEILDSKTFTDLETIDNSDFSSNLYSSIDYRLSKFTHVSDWASSVLNCINCMQYINLSGNLISSIDPNTFTGLKSLVELRLSSNQISYIDHASLTDLTSLKDLDLTNNRISSKSNFDLRSEMPKIFRSNC
jgi:Leucine-rich repeat (LRR) protein